MTVKKMLYFLQGMLGYNPVSNLVLEPIRAQRKALSSLPAHVAIPPQVDRKPAEKKSRLYQTYTSKKVLFLSKKGRKLTARPVGMDSRMRIILRRVGHPDGPEFVRPATAVFTR